MNPPLTLSPCHLVGWAALVVFLAGRWERNLPPRATAPSPPLLFPLGRWRWPLCAAAAAASIALLAVPLASLATQMHYGVTNSLAALCLLMLAAVGAGGALTALLGRVRRR